MKLTVAKNKGLFFFGIMALFAVCLLIRCAVNPVTGQNELMLVSEDQEIQMGKEVYPNALWGSEGGGGEYKDERTKAYLENVIVRIHKASHRPNLPVSFAIQNSSVPNAWAIPGHVVITRGLLAGLDNEAEFAFVMGHEMGHVSARHSARQMTYGMLTQIGLGVAGLALSGTDYGDDVLSLGMIGSSLLLLKFSRDDELEADGLGVAYMSKLGYDPRSALSAHRNLEKVSQEYVRSLGQEPQERGFFEDLLSTHPRTQVRLEEIQHMLDSTPRPAISGDGTNRRQFQDMVAGVRKTNKVYTDYYDPATRALRKNRLDEANNLLNRAITADRYQTPFYSLAAFVFLKKKNFAEAERYFSGALSIDANYQPAHRGLGAIDYQRANYQESIRHLQKSISLFPQDVFSHYFLGMGFYKTKSYREAIPHLGAFAETKTKHSSIHGVLGECYEKVNDMPSAYQQYAMQVQVAPNNATGRTAASRAAILKPLVEKQSEQKK